MRAVEQALRFYGRDSLWRRLIAPLNAPDQLTALTAEDFVVLSTRYNTMPLATFDPDLDTIWQLTTVWSRLLDFMARSYGSLAREFREHSGTGVFRHLIILNPQNSDLIIHFTVDLARNTIRADAVSREKDATGTVSAESTIELEFISDVVRAICRFLWSCAVY